METYNIILTWNKVSLPPIESWMQVTFNHLHFQKLTEVYVSDVDGKQRSTNAVLYLALYTNQAIHDHALWILLFMSAATETFPISTDLSINFSLASSWGLHNRNIKSSVPGLVTSGKRSARWKRKRSCTQRLSSWGSFVSCPQTAGNGDCLLL